MLADLEDTTAERASHVKDRIAIQKPTVTKGYAHLTFREIFAVVVRNAGIGSVIHSKYANEVLATTLLDVQTAFKASSI